MLDPKNLFESFNDGDIYKFAKGFSLENFTDQDIVTLKYEFIYYKYDVMHKPWFKNVSTRIELC